MVFPVTQTLYYLTEEGLREPAEDPRGLLVFLRACDIHGFARLDRIMLDNDPAPDPYYARLREKVKFVLLECRQSFDDCFCVAMGANQTDQYAMAVRFTAGHCWPRCAIRSYATPCRPPPSRWSSRRSA